MGVNLHIKSTLLLDNLSVFKNDSNFPGVVPRVNLALPCLTIIFISFEVSSVNCFLATLELARPP